MVNLFSIMLKRSKEFLQRVKNVSYTVPQKIFFISFLWAKLQTKGLHWLFLYRTALCLSELSNYLRIPKLVKAKKKTNYLTPSYITTTICLANFNPAHSIWANGWTSSQMVFWALKYSRPHLMNMCCYFLLEKMC